MGLLSSLAYFLRRNYLVFLFLFFGALALGGQFLDKLNVDDIQIDGNTISSTNTNGDINLDPNGSGGVAFPDLTASTVPYLDANKEMTSSSVTPTELGYISGLSSAIQTQIDGKLGTSLQSGYIFIGDGSNSATANEMSGDATLDNSGVLEIAAGVIENADVNASAAIAGTKLAYDNSTSGLIATNVQAGIDELKVYADAIDSDFDTHVADTTTHGTTGDIVGTSDAQTLTNKILTSAVLNTGVSGTAVLDEDNMVSDSATQLATQQSIKAYVDSAIGSPPPLTVESKTADFSATYGYLYLIDTQHGDVTASVDTAVGNDGESVEFKIIDDSNDLIIDPNSAETIEGSTLFYGGGSSVYGFTSDGSNLRLTNNGPYEYDCATNSTPTNWPITAGQWGDLTSMSLTPGTWELVGALGAYNNGSVTAGGLTVGISSTSGNSGTGLAYGQNRMDFYNTGTNTAWHNGYIVSYEVTVTGTTTYYLKGFASNTTNLQEIYHMCKRRIK